MSQKPNIYFYTGRFTHTFYQEIYKHKPEGFSFIPSTPELLGKSVKKDIRKAKKKRLEKFKRQLQLHAKNALIGLRLPNLKYIKIPKEADLVHSAQAMLLNHRPWVVDFEDVSVFGWYSRKIFECKRSRRMLEKRFEADHCRLLLPWTEAAKKSLLNGLNCEKFKDKIQVAYPVKEPQHPFREKKKKDGETIQLLFIGTAFYAKGGYETLLAFEKIAKDHNVHLTMLSFFPEDVKKRFGDHPQIDLLTGVSNERLEQAYKDADIFVYPVHTDTFGFVVLEAFTFGLPCISNRQFAIPEIVTEGETGLLNDPFICRFDDKYLPQYASGAGFLNQETHPMTPALKNPPAEYVDHLARDMVKLIEDESLRQEMSHNAYQTVASGRFSSEARKKRMAELYTQALIR